MRAAIKFYFYTHFKATQSAAGCTMYDTLIVSGIYKKRGVDDRS
jgi:hypothetical protein